MGARNYCHVLNIAADYGVVTYMGFQHYTRLSSRYLSCPALQH